MWSCPEKSTRLTPLTSFHRQHGRNHIPLHLGLLLLSLLGRRSFLLARSALAAATTAA
jgi:hypothetical protein